MAVLACVTLSLLVTAPQGEADPKLKPSLSKSEIGSLNKKAKKWIEAELKWEENPRKNRKNRERARAAFVKALGQKSKKKDVLANMGNLLGIFEQVFPYKAPRRRPSGEVSKDAALGFHLLGPRSYNDSKSYGSVLVLRGFDKTKKAWAEAKPYLMTAWKDSESVKDTIFVLPPLIKGDDYDKIPDLTSDAGLAGEGRRIKGVLETFGEINSARERVTFLHPKGNRRRWYESMIREL